MKHTQILVVDGDPASPVDLASVARAAFPGANIHKAADWDGARQTVASQPDLALAVLDLNAPGMDGWHGVVKARRTLDPPVRRALYTFTPRELGVFRQMADGKSNKLIARALNIAENTVKNHVAAILHKLQPSGIAGRRQAEHLAANIDFERLRR